MAMAVQSPIMTREGTRGLGVGLAGLSLLLLLARIVWGWPYGWPAGGTTARVADVQRLMLSAEAEGRDWPVSPREARDVIEGGLRAAPLSSTPLFAAAYLLGADEDALFDEALRRDKRSIAARRSRAIDFMSEGAAVEAVHEIGVLLRVNRSESPAYFDLLAAIADTVEGRPVVVDALSSRITWQAPVVRRLNQSSEDLGFLYELNRQYPGHEGALLRRLARDGQYDLAFVAWLDLLGVDPAAIEWPNDPRFEGDKGTEPFTWTLVSDQAERGQDGGLYVVHFGDAPVLFARQLMALGPGDYQLDAVADGIIPRGGTGVVIDIRCMGRRGRSLIQIVPIAGAARGEVVATGGFTIPADPSCAYQEVSIRGEALEQSRIARLEFRELTIEPAGRRDEG